MTDFIPVAQEYTIGPQESFYNAAFRSIIIAETLNCKVKFIYEGVVVNIDKNTPLELIERDFNTAKILGWERIGTMCVNEYSGELHKRIREAIQKQNNSDAPHTSQIDNIYSEIDTLKVEIKRLSKNLHETMSNLSTISTDIWLIKNEMKNLDIRNNKEKESRKDRFWLWK